MVTEVMSGMVIGVEGQLVKVQTDVSDGLPVFTMIGYLSNEVKEAKDRVRTALKNCGYSIPPQRISVNLAPGDTRKYGTWFDLAIAVSVLLSLGYMDPTAAEGFLFLGELSLDGRLSPLSGVLPIVMEACERGYRYFIVPLENAAEAALIEGTVVYGFSGLEEVCDFLLGADVEAVEGYQPDPGKKEEKNPVDFADIHGQTTAKRALEIAAAGFHNVFLTGPPGMGKSMLASAMPGIMPEMTMQERIETTMIHSVKGLLKEGFSLIEQRPFRAPSLGITMAGMFGGGNNPTPGEVSLAHHGVLFLDEFVEHPRSITENLRTVLENHSINLVRQERSITFPADFLLIAASNPCPCGFYPDRNRCHCMEYQIRNYQGRLSGPILDRMDLFVRCDEVPYALLVKEEKEESSMSVQKRVETARAMQKDRQNSDTSYYNGRMSSADTGKYCALTQTCQRMMEEAFDRLHLTGRSYYKLLKTARTIADLEESSIIREEHLIEAIRYRQVPV